MPKSVSFDIHKVANLAKLTLSSQEESKFGRQLTGILDFISKLQQLHTKHIAPTSQVTGLVNVFRKDEVDASRMLTQKQALKNAPASHNGCFKVPAILDKDV